ncbi:MAG: hypothetical protein AABX51_02475 [Nanoarchaeota archaeon]
MTRPTGPISAALLAANVGFITIGVLNFAAEVSAPTKTFLTFYKAMGALSGKVAIAYTLSAVVFLIFFKLWKDKEMDVMKWVWITIVCLIISTLLVFPPAIEPILEIIKG